MTINIAKDVVNKNKNYGKIRIYADDKKIYDSSDLTTKFKKNDLNLNIKDIKNLKIEYTISSSKSAGESNIFVALLGNPTLEKY